MIWREKHANWSEIFLGAFKLGRLKSVAVSYLKGPSKRPKKDALRLEFGRNCMIANFETSIDSKSRTDTSKNTTMTKYHGIYGLSMFMLNWTGFKRHWLLDGETCELVGNFLSAFKSGHLETVAVSCLEGPSKRPKRDALRLKFGRICIMASSEASTDSKSCIKRKIKLWLNILVFTVSTSVCAPWSFRHQAIIYMRHIE